MILRKFRKIAETSSPQRDISQTLPYVHLDCFSFDLRKIVYPSVDGLKNSGTQEQLRAQKDLKKLDSSHCPGFFWIVVMDTDS